MVAEPNGSGPSGAPDDAATADAGTRRRPHRWGLGAFLVVELAYVAVALAVTTLVVEPGRLTVAAAIVALLLPTIAAAALAVLITYWRGHGPRADLALHWSWRGAGIGLAFGLGGLVVTLPASVLYVSIVGTDANAAAAEVFGGLRTTWPWAVAVFCCAVLIAPVCEEIIFRGLLWGALEWRWGRWVAMSVTTVVFALAHFELTRAPILLLVGIPLGLSRMYGGTLLSSIVAHQVTNILPGVVIMLSMVGQMTS